MMVDMVSERDRASRMGCGFGFLLAVAVAASVMLSMVHVECSGPACQSLSVKFTVTEESK